MIVIDFVTILIILLLHRYGGYGQGGYGGGYGNQGYGG